MPLDPNQFYGGLRDGVAYNLLQRYGFSAAIQVKSGEVFDPVSGEITTPAKWFVFPCVAVYGGGSSGMSGGTNRSTESKTLTRVTKKDVYLDATLLTITPSPDDLFQDENGDTFEILTASLTNPGGVTVIQRITVAK